MTANELRIGNITSMGVVYYIEDDIFRVVNDEGDSIKNTWARIEPIPLTEEWLLKFGFEKTSLHYLKKNGIIIQKENDEFYECFLGSIIVKIKHIHQLQNLYFALTGEELTFKS